MRRTILLSLITLLAASACDACAQRRGGGGIGFARGGYGFGRGRGFSPNSSGYGYLPFGYGYADLPYDSGAGYGYAPQPVTFVQQPPMFVPPPPPPVTALPVHPVVTNYKWPAAGTLLPPPHLRQPPSPSHRPLPLSSRTVRPSPPKSSLPLTTACSTSTPTRSTCAFR